MYWMTENSFDQSLVVVANSSIEFHFVSSYNIMHGNPIISYQVPGMKHTTCLNGYDSYNVIYQVHLGGTWVDSSVSGMYLGFRESDNFPFYDIRRKPQWIMTYIASSFPQF